MSSPVASSEFDLLLGFAGDFRVERLVQFWFG